jgi:hypothetical protein
MRKDEIPVEVSKKRNDPTPPLVRSVTLVLSDRDIRNQGVIPF